MSREVHSLAPDEFLDAVHSFEFWFHSIQGYLANTEFGHRPGTPKEELPTDRRERLITVLCNYCVGETAALDGASGLIGFAPNRQSKIFLATQVVDEARHLEVLIHRLSELGVANPEQEIQLRSTRSLSLFRRRLIELVASKDWEAAIFAQNVILEAMEFAAFQSHARDADPITRELLEGIIVDERRHMGFGENDLGRRLALTPHVRARLLEVKRELDPLVLETFEEMLSELGVPRSERPELGRNYLATVERLGFGS